MITRLTPLAACLRYPVALASQHILKFHPRVELYSTSRVNQTFLNVLAYNFKKSCPFAMGMPNAIVQRGFKNPKSPRGLRTRQSAAKRFIVTGKGTDCLVVSISTSFLLTSSNIL